jgi:hypothetical protein
MEIPETPAGNMLSPTAWVFHKKHGQDKEKDPDR